LKSVNVPEIKKPIKKIFADIAAVNKEFRLKNSY